MDARIATQDGQIAALADPAPELSQANEDPVGQLARLSNAVAELAELVESAIAVG